MGLPPSISSYRTYPPHKTGKEQETTKMTQYKIEDEYIVEYQYIRQDGSFGRKTEQTVPLYCLPTMLKTFGELEARVVIKSCEKVVQ